MKNKEFGKWFDELKFLAKLSRPVSIPAGMTLVNMGMISVDGFALHKIPEVLAVGIPIAYFLWAPNDYFDRESDQDNERKGWLFGAKVTEENAGLTRHASIFSIAFGLLTALLLSGLARWSMISLVVISILYSVPPFRLRSVPIVDSLLIAAGAFSVFALGVGMGGGDFASIIDGAYWFSLIAAAGNGVGTLPDIKSDRKAGIRTTGTLLGWRPTVSIAILTIAISLLMENWSYITDLFLKTQILIMSLLLIKPDKKTWKLWAIGGSGIGLVFGLYWIIFYKLKIIPM